MESRIPISPIHHALTEVEGHCPSHDNARPCITQTVKTVFTDYKCEALSHTASPSTSPPDYKCEPLSHTASPSTSPPDYKCEPLSHTASPSTSPPDFNICVANDCSL